MNSRRQMLHGLAAIGALAACKSKPSQTEPTTTDSPDEVDVAALNAALKGAFAGTVWSTEFENFAEEGEALRQALLADHPALADMVAHISNAVCTPWLQFTSSVMSRTYETDADVEALLGDMATEIKQMVIGLQAPLEAAIAEVAGSANPGTADISDPELLAERQRREIKMRRSIRRENQTTQPLINLLLQGVQATTASTQGELSWSAVTEELEEHFKDANAFDIAWAAPSSNPYEDCALAVAGAFGIGAGAYSTITGFVALISWYALSAELAFWFATWFMFAFYSLVIGLLVAILLLLIVVAIYKYIDLIIECVAALEGTKSG